MKNSFRISVKKPCSEQFENFTTTEKGGFCGSCQKEVIDFTTMPEAELMNYFSNNNSETCGRFRKAQLKTYKTTPMRVTSNNFLSRSIGMMSFSLLSLCAVANLQAQDVASLNTPIKTEATVLQKLETTNSIAAEKYTITGTVVDEENEPLAGVNVILKGTTEGAVTDFDGKFEFPRALEVDDTLIFSYIGYATKEYTVTASKSETIDITITFDFLDIELMGEVVIGGAYKTKRNIFQKFIGLFK